MFILNAIHMLSIHICFIIYLILNSYIVYHLILLLLCILNVIPLLLNCLFVFFSAYVFKHFYYLF